MEKTPRLTKNQIRLLEGLCDCWTFEQQVALAGEIWPDKFREIRRSFSRLHNLGLITWVPESETSFESRWWVEERGVRFLLDGK